MSQGKIAHQLDDKCRWYGKKYIEISRWFPSSKRCSHSGYIVDKMPLSLRGWECPECRTRHNREINARKNILTVGLAVSVCGAT